MRTESGRWPLPGSNVIVFARRGHHGCASAAREAACIAPSVSTVTPFTPRVAASSASFDHHLPGILPRERQLLTTEGDSMPSASATTDVPPKSLINVLTVMEQSIFTFCEGVNPHTLAIAPADLAKHALAMAKRYAQTGKRLTALRVALGISQAELCRQIKCQTNRWNQYESGERRITIPIAMRLADVYGASMDWVYRGETRHLPMELFAKIQRAA